MLTAESLAEAYSFDPRPTPIFNLREKSPLSSNVAIAEKYYVRVCISNGTDLKPEIDYCAITQNAVCTESNMRNLNSY